MYGKIYEQTFTGSMVGSGAAVFALWAYIIAHTGPDHLVEVNSKLVSAAIGCAEEELAKALEILTAPDPESRSKAHEGRRLIRQGEFLYFVPNHERFRALRDDGSRREYMRKYMQNRRKQKKLTGVNAELTPHSEAEAEAYKKKKPPLPPKGGGGEEEIYSVYPRKESKPDALRAIKKALTKTKPGYLLERTRIFAGIWAEAPAERKRYIPYPATWFNRERYNDSEDGWRLQAQDEQATPRQRAKEAAPTGAAYRPLYELEDEENWREAKLTEKLNKEAEQRKRNEEKKN